MWSSSAVSAKFNSGLELTPGIFAPDIVEWMAGTTGLGPLSFAKIPPGLNPFAISAIPKPGNKNPDLHAVLVEAQNASSD
jgi:hypothetical protein